MSPDPSVLDRNLAALVGRAWDPVLPRPEFRVALEREVLSSVERRTAPPRRRLAPWVVAASLAAAAAVSVLVLRVTQGEREPSRDAILSGGRVAWRTPDADGGGAWRGHAGATLALPPLPLEAATPAAAGVELVGEGARTVLSADARARVEHRSASPEEGREVALVLERGSARLELASGAEPWSVVLGPARVRLEAGVLEVRVAGDGLALHLLDGAARAHAPPAPPRELSPGVRGRLTREGFAPEPSATALRTPAAPEEDEGRAAVEPTEAAPTVEPPVAPRLATLVLDVRGPAGPLPADAAVRVSLLEAVDVPRFEELRVVRPVRRDDGSFALTGLEPNRYRLDVAVESYALWRGEPVELAAGETERLAVELVRARVVRGTVVDPGGRPIAGAWVLSEHDAPDQPLAMDRDQLPELVAAVAETDDEGRFELGLRPGTHVLRAAHPEHAPGWSEPFEVGAGAAPELEIALQRGARIHGRVDAEDGSPSPGEVLVANRVDYDRVVPRMSYRGAETDVRGEYAMDGLPAGSYVVLLLREPAPVLRFLDLAAGDDVRVDFTRSFTGARVFGRLTTDDGDPVPYMGVSIALAGASRSDDHEFTYTDAEGAYELREVPPGEYELYVTPDRGFTVVRVGDLDVPDWVSVERDFQLPTTGVEGIVFDGERGVPLDRAVVIVAAVSAPDDYGRFVARVFTGDDGRFSLPHVRRDLYRVSGIATTRVLGSEYVEDVLPRDDGEPVELVLRAGAVVRTRAVDGSGRPVAGASVTFRNEAGLRIPFQEHDVTGADGVHRATGLKPGAWTLTVEAPGREPVERALSVAAGEDALVEVVLRP